MEFETQHYRYALLEMHSLAKPFRGGATELKFFKSTKKSRFFSIY